MLAKAARIVRNESETLVVVKSLSLHGERAQTEFRTELEMFGKLNHKNIVKVLGVSRDTDTQYLITEYCEWVSTGI